MPDLAAEQTLRIEQEPRIEQELHIDQALRIALRARSHHLDPVVLLGVAGLTEAALREIDRALAAHELIKIRVPGDDRTQRQALLAQIADRLGAAPIQAIGKLLVVYRPRPLAPAAPPGQAGPPNRTKRTERTKRTKRSMPSTQAAPAKQSRQARRPRPGQM